VPLDGHVAWVQSVHGCANVWALQVPMCSKCSAVLHVPFVQDAVSGMEKKGKQAVRDEFGCPSRRV
jgi:hypothetical protein